MQNEVYNDFHKIPKARYQIIYVDPPWPEYGGGKCKRGADKHYNLMSLSEIRALDVERIAAPNCHLYLWATNNYLMQAGALMRHWGFVYKTTITWGKDRFGLGQYFRGQTEHCLFGVKGSLPYKIVGGKRQQSTTLLLSDREQHSKKPDEMRKRIEKVSDRNGFHKIELFARVLSPGWDIFGNEIQENKNAE